jgi:hypothetical protein
VSGCSVQLVLCVQADARIESEPFRTDANLKHHIDAVIRAASFGTAVHSTNMISAAHCGGKSIGAVELYRTDLNMSTDLCKRKMQNTGALKYALYSSSAQISFLFPFRNTSKFLVLVSKETHFVREGNIADKLEYNEASAQRMKMTFILQKFIGDFAKIEKEASSFDVSAVCLHLHGTIQLSLDGFSLKLVFE